MYLGGGSGAPRVVETVAAETVAVEREVEVKAVAARWRWWRGQRRRWWRRRGWR